MYKFSSSELELMQLTELQNNISNKTDKWGRDMNKIILHKYNGQKLCTVISRLIFPLFSWAISIDCTRSRFSSKLYLWQHYKEVLNFDLYKLSEFLGHNPRNSQIDKRPSRQQSFQTLNISFLIFIYTKWSHAFHNYWISVAAAGEELPQQGANFHWG